MSAAKGSIFSKIDVAIRARGRRVFLASSILDQKPLPINQRRLINKIKNCTSDNPCCLPECAICSYIKSFFINVDDLDYTITISENKSPSPNLDSLLLYSKLKKMGIKSIVVPDIRWSESLNLYDFHYHIMCNKNDSKYMKYKLGSDHSKPLENPSGFFGYISKQNDNVLNEFRNVTNKYKEEQKNLVEFRLKHANRFRPRLFNFDRSLLYKYKNVNIKEVALNNNIKWRAYKPRNI